MLQTDLLSIQIKPFCPKPLLGTTRVCMMGFPLGSEVYSIPLSPYKPGHNDTYLLGDSQPPKQAPTLTPSSSCDFSLKRSPARISSPHSWGGSETVCWPPHQNQPCSSDLHQVFTISVHFSFRPYHTLDLPCLFIYSSIACPLPSPKWKFQRNRYFICYNCMSKPMLKAIPSLQPALLKNVSYGDFLGG